MDENNDNGIIGEEALGRSKTRGLVAGLEAADAMAKAENITVLKKRAIGGGYITVMVRGDVGAVRTALGAGRNAASQIGEVVATRIIPGPHFDLENLLPKVVSDLEE